MYDIYEYKIQILNNTFKIKFWKLLHRGNIIEIWIKELKGTWLDFLICARYSSPFTIDGVAVITFKKFDVDDVFLLKYLLIYKRT